MATGPTVTTIVAAVRTAFPYMSALSIMLGTISDPKNIICNTIKEFDCKNMCSSSIVCLRPVLNFCCNITRGERARADIR